MKRTEKFTRDFLERKDLVMKYIYRRIGKIEEAEELTQEVFMAYYENMDFVDSDMIKPWLLLTARNKCVDYMRKRDGVKETSFTDWAEQPEVIQQDNLEMMVDRIIQEDFTYRILGDLKRKNEKWYDVLVAVSICGLEQAEAAEYLKISVEILRARLYRARRFIKRYYEEEYRKL